MDEATFRREMEASGRPVTIWGNAPGDVYARHAHAYRKYLCCIEGSITFTTPDGEVALEAGGTMVLEPGTPHSARVGPAGTRCAEAHERP